MTHLELLLGKAQENKLALLVGRDLPAALTARPSGQELARGLASKYNLPASDSLAETAQDQKEREQSWKYTGYLQQKLSGGEAGPLHRAIAALPLPFFMTMTCDDRLARALAAAGRPANVLIEDNDFSGRNFDRPDLIKLCGDLSRLHTLVIAEDEYLDLLLDDDRRKLFDRVGEWLREKTVLLVGCEPIKEGDFENLLYWEVLKQLGAFGAESYLLWPGPTADDATRWARRNVTLIDAEPLAFLNSLAGELGKVQIAPLVDKEKAALEELARILSGAEPPQDQVDAALDKIPSEKRPKSIGVTLRLWLSDEAKLQSIVNIDYAPDVTHYHGHPRDTGITLRRLRNWAAKAQETRLAWELPQSGPVEERAIDFFDEILPPGSGERGKYELALRDCQLLKAALHIIFELQDERGRLSPLPWELLHDGRVGMGRGFLGLNYPVYRLPDSVSSFDQVTGHIQKALIVAADPTGRLTELDAEVDWLVAALKTAGVAQVDLRRPDDDDVSDPEAIKRLLRDGGYQLFHFTGHGLFDDDDPSKSKLVLGKFKERGKELTAAALAQVARESELILVFLSACQVGGEAEREESRPWQEAGIVDALTRAGVPATLGMRWNVGDENGRKLAQNFYTELLNGKSAEHALMLARQAVIEQPDWANPILTKRRGVL